MRILSSLQQISESFDAIVFDQWGVLHDGTTPYLGVFEAIATLPSRLKLAVLSNSGKRAMVNKKRIAQKGYPEELFEHVMTSGEAFWQECAQNPERVGRVYAITAEQEDALQWADGLFIDFTNDVNDADSVLLMGLPEGQDHQAFERPLQRALSRKLPLICTNPDRVSPRAGRVQISPGSLAHTYQEKGGEVIFYGKPHPPIFQALQKQLGVAPERILMIGDSLEHDIAGAQKVGWRSLLIQGGLTASHYPEIQNLSTEAQCRYIERYANLESAPLPDYSMFYVR